MCASLSTLKHTNTANERGSITICHKFVRIETSLVNAIGRSRCVELNIETLCMENTILADKNNRLVSMKKTRA